MTYCGDHDKDHSKEAREVPFVREPARHAHVEEETAWPHPPLPPMEYGNVYVTQTPHKCYAACHVSHACIYARMYICVYLCLYGNVYVA
jgi:hypothetical protein